VLWWPIYHFDAGFIIQHQVARLLLIKHILFMIGCVTGFAVRLMSITSAQTHGTVCKPRRFSPVDMEIGPDGSIYMLNMVRLRDR